MARPHCMASKLSPLFVAKKSISTPVWTGLMTELPQNKHKVRKRKFLHVIETF